MPYSETHIGKSSTPDGGPPPLPGGPSVLHASFFGHFSLASKGEEIYFKKRKAKELLAFLIAEKGKHLSKAFIAENLWPNLEEGRGLDNLYKAYRYLLTMKADGIDLPIHSLRNEIWIDMSSVQPDFLRFEHYYNNKENLDFCKEAVTMYKSSFLSGENYEWVSSVSSYYELRYMEVIETLIAFHKSSGNKIWEDYYRNLLEI